MNVLPLNRQFFNGIEHIFDSFRLLVYTGVDNNSCYRLQEPVLNSMATQPLVRLSISEAAKLFGVSTRTVRRAIAEEAVTYIVVQGRYKVNFESLLRWSQDTTTIRNKRDKKGIGQFVDQWKIKNKLYSPNPKIVESYEEKG